MVDATRLALTTADERLRMKVLLGLHGIAFPTASTLTAPFRSPRHVSNPRRPRHMEPGRRPTPALLLVRVLVGLRPDLSVTGPRGGRSDTNARPGTLAIREGAPAVHGLPFACTASRGRGRRRSRAQQVGDDASPLRARADHGPSGQVAWRRLWVRVWRLPEMAGGPEQHAALSGHPDASLRVEAACLAGRSRSAHSVEQLGSNSSRMSLPRIGRCDHPRLA